MLGKEGGFDQSHRHVLPKEIVAQTASLVSSSRRLMDPGIAASDRGATVPIMQGKACNELQGRCRSLLAAWLMVPLAKSPSG